MWFLYDYKAKKARKILQKHGFNNIVNRVCSVVNSVTKNGIGKYSFRQLNNADEWAHKVIRDKFDSISKQYDTETVTFLFDEYDKAKQKLDFVYDRNEALIFDWTENELSKTKQENLVFAIDVDSVLRDNLGEMVRIYNEHFNDNKTVEDITDYKTETIFPRIEEETGQTSSQWFFQDHSDELFVKAKPFKHANEDVKKLREFGKVIIVTYQKTSLNKVQTLEWLDANDIPYDGIVFTKDKSIVDCDYFIDDNDWNFTNNNADHGILINAPYNKNIDLNELKNKTHCCDIQRFNSLHDFVTDFVKNNKN